MNCHVTNGISLWFLNPQVDETPVKESFWREIKKASRVDWRRILIDESLETSRN